MNMIKQRLIDANYQPLADEIDHYFAQSNIVLHDARNQLKEVVFNDEILVVKSFRRPSAINRIIYRYFRQSKAKRSYEFGLKIAQWTPGVVAYVEYYQQGLLSKSYFIAKKYQVDFDIRPALLDEKFADRVRIFQQFAAFVYQLHQNNILHQDLSPGNILIRKNQQDYEFKIIDINRMHFKTLSLKERAKNFNKLWANDADLGIMLKAYAKLGKFDETNFIQLGIKYNQQNKTGKIRKRKIKQALGL